MTPTLGIVIPTAGRPTLAATLESIHGQDLIPDGDCVLVVGDTTDGPLPAVEATVRDYAARGLPVAYLAHAGPQGHDWGHSQVNAGQAALAGRTDYLLVQDDDDLYLPGALTTIRDIAAAKPTRTPAMVRFLSYNSGVVWRSPGIVAEGWVGGHCLVAPNDPPRLAPWGPHYEGDYTAIVDTLAHYGGASWHAPICTHARPPLTWRRVQGEYADLDALRQLRNAGRAWLRHTAELEPEDQAYWWASHNPERLRAYLFARDGVTVGAGLLSLRDDGRWWVTVLVAPEHRGGGVGRTIYAWLGWSAPWPVHAEIRRDNLASERAARSVGYADAEAPIDAETLPGGHPGYLYLTIDLHGGL